MIRRITSLAVGITVAALATTAFAQDEEAAPAGDASGAASGQADASMDGAPDAGGKIKIGLRLGYGIPMGDAVKDGKLSDGVSGMIPIWLDLGYMVTPNIMLGVYGQYGIVMLSSDAKDACDAAKIDCSASNIRLGVQGQYHLSPAESLDPWFGLGIGYEMMNTTQGDGSSGLSGLEFANIQAGADFKVADSLGVGPFVSFSLGQYSSMSADPEPTGFDGSIKDKGMHQWLTLGVKGTFGL